MNDLDLSDRNITIPRLILSDVVLEKIGREGASDGGKKKMSTSRASHPQVSESA